MPKPFYERLKGYYSKVGEVLRGEADAASVFPNSSDLGGARELIYVDFLKQHIPSKCNVFRGGYLFGEDGSESKQIDIIISTDTAPRYNLFNADGNGKSFCPVEGCLGVASIKSNLDKSQLLDALQNIASIPPTQPIGNRINPQLKFEGYGDWPYKIIYASNGLDSATILSHIEDFYKTNSTIPLERQPDIIHVVGKYVIFRIKKGMTIVDNLNKAKTDPKVGSFYMIDDNADTQAMMWVLNDLQEKATLSTHIIFNYVGIINKISED